MPNSPSKIKLPKSIGRYEVRALLGRGGMGAVYDAFDPKIERRVALKIPHERVAENPQGLERFFREARAAGGLNHPGICPVYDVDEENGLPFIAMAFIDGTPLLSRIRDERPMNQGDIRDLAVAIAETLAFAHESGVVHRDLKPDNIMLTKANRPVIMDFGLAWQPDRDESRLTADGSMMGTPAYMPPEQIQGKREEVGVCSDIYSFGVVLFEMLTGRLPFEGTAMNVLALALMQDAPAPSQFRPSLSKGWDALCEKMLAKQPSDRFDSMADVVAALKACELESNRPPVMDGGKARGFSPSETLTPNQLTDTEGLAVRPLQKSGESNWAKRKQRGESTPTKPTPLKAETHLIDLLESQRVTQPQKLFALSRFVAEKNYLPGGLESLLEGQPTNNTANSPSLTALLLQLGPAKSAEFLHANLQRGNPLDSPDAPPRLSLKKFRHILMSLEQVQKSDPNFYHVFQSVVESVCQNGAQRNVLRGFVFGRKTSDSQRKRFLRATGRNSALLQLLRDELTHLHMADSAAEFRQKLFALQAALQCKFWPSSSFVGEQIDALGSFADRQDLLQRAVAGEREAGWAFARIAEVAFPPNPYTATTSTELAEMRATDVLALSSTLQAPQELPHELYDAFVEYFERSQWNYVPKNSPAATPQHPPPSRKPMVEQAPENEQQVAEKKQPLARTLETVGNYLIPISASLMAIILLVLIRLFFS